MLPAPGFALRGPWRALRPAGLIRYSRTIPGTPRPQAQRRAVVLVAGAAPVRVVTPLGDGPAQARALPARAGITRGAGSGGALRSIPTAARPPRPGTYVRTTGDRRQVAGVCRGSPRGGVRTPSEQRKYSYDGPPCSAVLLRCWSSHIGNLPVLQTRIVGGRPEKMQLSELAEPL